MPILLNVIFHFGLDQKIPSKKSPRNPPSRGWGLGIFEAENPQKSPGKISEKSLIPGMGIWDFWRRKIPKKSTLKIWGYPRNLRNLYWRFFIPGIFRVWIFYISGIFWVWGFFGIFYPQDFLGMGIFRGWVLLEP